jgi:beta-galactosidase
MIARLHPQTGLFALVPAIVLLGLCVTFVLDPLPVSAQGQGNGLMTPSITSQPVSQTVTTGQSATFIVAATGTPPPKYQWMKNGVSISGATSSSYTTPPTISSDNGAQFTVVAFNKLDSIISNVAALTVIVPPTITSQPASQTVTAGQSATLTVAAMGSAPQSYQWKKSGGAISGATSSSYTTPGTTTSDNGAQFTVEVSNPAGNATSNTATLTVNAAAVAPSITTQPVSQTVTAGQTVTFTVAATGTAPLSYQWKKNGGTISGATGSSYKTPTTTSSDNGAQFTVVVSNSAGSVTSNAATLTVKSSTVLLNANPTNLSFGSVTVGSTSTLSVTLTNAGNSNVTISNVSISGAGYTAAGVSTGQILTPAQTATLNVTFSPSATGTLTGSVTVTSDATNSPATVSLSGSGVQPVSHSVTLTWSPSTSSVTGYNVYRSSASGGSYAKLNSTVVTTTSYDDSAVQAGQTYYYVVTSVDSSNVESAYSSPVSASVPSP